MMTKGLEVAGGGEGSQELAQTPFEEICQEKLRPLLELNDRINVLASSERDINATRIVVVGDQSHGKSSVLEALSGVDLPRGEGIQTRVPLVMQLRDLGSKETTEYGLIRVQSETGVDPERISLDAVAEKTKEYTSKIAGNGKDVQDTPIELTIFRKGQIDLTLVDLPGITRVALEDQAGGDGKALEALLLNMCRKYMEPEESIILNVVSAMVDFSTSASLQLSRELDSMGCRTLLCVTKIDQHKETGLAEKIRSSAEAMKLRHENTFAVRNRTQEENDTSLALNDARQIERNYLNAASDLLESSEHFGIGLGVEALSRRLGEIQYTRLKETLPKTGRQVAAKIKHLEEQLQLLGKHMDDETVCRLEARRLLRDLNDRLLHERTRASLPAKTFPLLDESKFSIRVADHSKVDPKKVLKSGKVDFFADAVTLSAELVKKEDESFSVSLSCDLDSSIITSATIFTILRIDAVAVDDRVLEVNHTFDMSSRIHSFIALDSEDITLLKNSPTVDFKFVASLNRIELNHVGLRSLDADLCLNIDKVCKNNVLLSGGMFAKLKAQSDISPDFEGMPGSTAPDVPVIVIKSLQKDIDSVIDQYVISVGGLTKKKIEAAITSTIDRSLFPKLHSLALNVAEESMAQQSSLAKDRSQLLLQWEKENIHTNNHCYMSTVQSLREHIWSDEDSKSRPDHLPSTLTKENVKKMSNAEQQLVDMQFQMFAYWKTMKKRLIDYTQLCARSTLCSGGIETFCTMLSISVTKVSSAVKLMAPDSEIARSRARLKKRIDTLSQAVDLLKEHSFSTR